MVCCLHLCAGPLCVVSHHHIHQTATVAGCWCALASHILGRNSYDCYDGLDGVCDERLHIQESSFRPS